MTFQIDNISSQKGRIAIVTGANIGLGFETTRALAKTGMHIVMACRNIQKAEKAKAVIQKEVANAYLEIIQLDLNSLDSVRNFAEEYKNRYNRLDLLINNAGIMIPPFAKTKDGFESQMGVNYFGHFLLTNILFPLLNKTENSRIVSLSSIAHENGEINFENLNAEMSYSKMKAYQQSKLACLMFSIELQRRINDARSKVLSVAAHPGVSNTNLGQHISRFWYKLFWPLISLFSHHPEKAAMPTLMAALDAKVQGGEYFGPTGYRGMKGKPGKVQPKPHAFDINVAKKLWSVSEELTGKTFALNNDF